MEVLRDGTFTVVIPTDALAKGIRPSKRLPRDSKFLVQCIGAVGIDNVLQVLEDLELNRIDVSATITDTFPHPQMFVFVDTVIFCSITAIYEWDGSSLTSKISALTPGTLWSAVAYQRFIFLTNGQVSVVRSPTTGLYALTTIYPAAEAVADFNGQPLLGGFHD